MAVLVEREAELGRLRDLAESAVAGSGAAVLVEGPAGIGKSTLLGAVRELAAERGVEYLHPDGGELERDFAYGVVRGLFAPLLARAEELEPLFDGPAALSTSVVGIPAPAGAAALPGADPGAVLHGLFWLVANLAARGLPFVSVDDLHRVDAASLRFVAYLARRVDELPVLLVAASRPPPESHAPELLERLVADPLVHLLEPPLLSAAGVAELLRYELGSVATRELERACHRATGGNPLFVRAGARALDSREGELDIESVPEAGSGAIARSVALRLSSLGEDAAELARAAAVLGASGELRHAAALAGLGDGPAADAADALVASGILAGIRPLEFPHPIVLSAVYRGISPADRSRRHLAAGRLLEAEKAEGSASSRICSQPSRVRTSGWSTGCATPQRVRLSGGRRRRRSGPSGVPSRSPRSRSPAARCSRGSAPPSLPLHPRPTRSRTSAPRSRRPTIRR